MNRILVVQTAFLGDVVLTTPLLRELRRAHPRARVVVLANPAGAAVLEGFPHVDEIRAYDKRGREKGWRATLRLARALRGEKFDLAVAAQRSARTGMLVWASGAKTRVGFAGSPSAIACTRRVAWDPSRHAVHRYLALAKEAGGDPERADPAPELAVTAVALRGAERALEEAGVPPGSGRLAVAPGSIWGTKRWTPAGFARVVRDARERGLHPVLVGSPSERALCEEVRTLSGGEAAVLAGRISIAELTALLAGSRALVTNDSGPGHVASAVGTPVVSVFGPTVPDFGYTPWGEKNQVVEQLGLDCRPCHAHGPQVCPLGHHHCMTQLPPERVLAAIDVALAER